MEKILEIDEEIGGLITKLVENGRHEEKRNLCLEFNDVVRAGQSMYNLSSAPEMIEDKHFYPYIRGKVNGYKEFIGKWFEGVKERFRDIMPVVK